MRKRRKINQTEKTAINIGIYAGVAVGLSVGVISNMLVTTLFRLIDRDITWSNLIIFFLALIFTFYLIILCYNLIFKELKDEKQ